ncbi:hypothetical protein [Thalassotalea maritima]|uniref:hypothetical protein n=1 Tax=Thalassotalea maritima TaxID=3242416 RepID=UPI00352814B8
MNHNEQKEVELNEVWQSISHEAPPSSTQLANIAGKEKIKNAIYLAGDVLGNLVLAALLYAAWQHDRSLVTLSWLGLALVYGAFLSWQFYKIRGLSHQALLESTSSYHDYLIKRAHGDIKAGKLFNVSTLVITTTMVVVFVIEQWWLGPPLISSAKQWLFLLCWTLFWVSLMAYYGVWKIRRGRQALANLQKGSDDG